MLKAAEKGFWTDALNSPWTCVPATPPPQIITGYTVRRAVPRVGRNELRRELEQAREQLEALHVEPPTPAAPEDTVDREPLLLESEDLGHQPVRLPASSKRFVEHFSNLPRPVARSVMLLVGRLAAGDSAAFAGVKRLRALPEVYRQRVAGDYRLLFRLRPDALELADLVNRKDLERTIKSLA